MEIISIILFGDTETPEVLRVNSLRLMRIGRKCFHHWAQKGVYSLLRSNMTLRAELIHFRIGGSSKSWTADIEDSHRAECLEK